MIPNRDNDNDNDISTPSPGPGSMPRARTLAAAAPAPVQALLSTDLSTPVDDDPDTDPEYTPQEVQQGNMRMTFLGKLVAAVDTEKPNNPRWTEIELYRTSQGTYIAQFIGVSVVAHSIACVKVQGKPVYRFDMLKDYEAPPEKREPCPACNPDIKKLMKTDPASLTFESDKYSMAVWDSATELVHHVVQAASSHFTSSSGSGSYSTPLAPPAFSRSNLPVPPNILEWVVQTAANVDDYIAEAYNKPISIG